MNNAQVTTYQKVSNAINEAYSADQIEMIQSAVAKDTTPQELAFFLSLCDRKGLDPFNKEVWCYKDHKGNLVMFTGRDGFLKMAQKNKDFDGMRSCEVCENDIFEANVATGEIDHKVTFADRGRVIGAYAIVFKRGGEKTIELATFTDYYKGKKANGDLIYSSPWNTTPAEMIKKVAESHALKKAFGLTGISSEHDREDDYHVDLPKEREIVEAPVITDHPTSREMDEANHSQHVFEPEY